MCCFWCPARDFEVRDAGALCPTCGRDYETPLQQPPTKVGSFVIEEPISRGFYSAVYRARQESLRKTVVIKLVPVAVYEYFEKDWIRECEEHAAISEGTPFVAGITDQFTDVVAFGGSELQCYVAVLENIAGPVMARVLANPKEHGLTPRMASQIAADLFEIMHLFFQKKRSHNDLHAGNIIIQTLGPQMLRSGAIDPSVRAVAIDLGSVSDKSRSGDHEGRVLGDQHQVARHLADLAAAVRANITSDLEYRVAGALRGLAEHLSPAASAQRVMSVDDASRVIRDAMSAIDEPWRQSLSLHRFGDAYNAQVLESWHVPELWFDPDNRWLTKTTVRGPQVITGMRGCGKTMLLRALHLHARAAVPSSSDGSGRLPNAITSDSFLGIYASCQKLLNPQDHGGESTGTVNLPFERLYIAYLRDAVQVLRHLRSLDPQALRGSIDLVLRDALLPLELDDSPRSQLGERAFMEFLVDLQFRLADGTARCRLRMASAEAFGHLAAVIQGASAALEGKYVLFLLDDVSTRYLHYDDVRKVISQLLFQHPRCAFRITTEAQALQRVLRSPGGSAPADPSRDYEEFNLGNEVYRLLQEGSTKRNMEFVSEILRRRGRQFRDELYRREPIDLLGDVELEVIASEIADSSATSAARKRVYRGLRALQAVCVGDLGDVVKLYERILQRANISDLPVPAEKQSDCFLEHSAGLMHFLNRRDQHQKGLALAFSQAAGELLQRSAAPNGGGNRRLRQYTKLYVRVDAGPDFEKVASSLLDLLDAGVFVYDGGVPRTKTRDDDPVLQFKLSFRKMLGLASYIGLSDRDRFELSGDTLKRWLAHPDEAKEILVASEAGKGSVKEFTPDQHLEDSAAVQQTQVASRTGKAGKPRKAVQLALEHSSRADSEELYTPSLGLSGESCDLESLRAGRVDTLILALGFEERALASADRILHTVAPRRALLIHYTNDQGLEIRRLVDRSGVPHEIVTGVDDLRAALKASENVLVDSTGMSKPFLFVAVRDGLRLRQKVAVVHTAAEDYYPRNEDLRLRGIRLDGTGSPPFESLEDLLVGEAGPYRLCQVHEEQAEPDRWRALIASASPKNDRLLHLFDARSYDAARILVPPANSERSLVARAAAELAASAADSNVGLKEVDTNDLHAALRATEEIYNDLYYGSGANVEIGLTGSKIHAIVFAGLAAVGRVASAWYVSPTEFDRQRFTTGVGATRCFKLTVAV